MKTNIEKHINGDISIQVMEKFEDLKKIRSFWEQVQWHPYTDIDYFIRFAKAHQGFIKPHAMLLSIKGKPQTLIIGWVQDERKKFKIGYKTVLTLKARCLHIEYVGILGDASYSNCAALIEEIQKYLKNEEVDFAYFKSIKHDSEAFQGTTQVPSFLHRDHFLYLNPHWKLSLPNSFKEFYQKRSKNTKSNIRKYKNRIIKGFGQNYNIRCFQGEDEVDQAMKDIETIAAKTYQRGLNVGFVNTPEARNEYIFAAQKGMLRAYVLYLNNIPSSFLIGFVYKNIFNLGSLGFDPEKEYYHPGMFLFLKMIEESCLDDKIDAIDFGFGDADYKKKYGDECWQEVSVFIFANTLKGMQFNAMKSLTTVFSRYAIKILGCFNMLDWVKRKWRRRLASAEV